MTLGFLRKVIRFASSYLGELLYVVKERGRSVKEREGAWKLGTLQTAFNHGTSARHLRPSRTRVDVIFHGAEDVRWQRKAQLPNVLAYYCIRLGTPRTQLVVERSGRQKTG